MYINRKLVEALAASNIIKRLAGPNDDDRPVVFWHGMGDSYNSTAMQRVFNVVHDERPDKFVHSVFIDPDDSKDQQAGLVGKVEDQIETVCQQLKSVPELENGFDFIGFSQGGLFARAAIEKCDLKVHTLVTFGSPHAGVKDLPLCNDGDWLCKRRNAFLKKQVWKDSVQGSVISAQYFRDPQDYDNYLEHSSFLADANNERPGQRNETYVENLSRLNRLVLVQFDKDDTLVDKSSAWFYDEDRITGLTIPFNESDFYQYDCVGLKKLYDENRIDYLSIDDRHMAISDDFIRDIVNTYLGKPWLAGDNDEEGQTISTSEPNNSPKSSSSVLLRISAILWSWMNLS